ncbi:pyrimidine nucleotide-sugar transmembrane transporter [Malassezia pachydermatis]
MKWQDMQCVEHCKPNSSKKPVLYSQPVWQTLQMFTGEAVCVLMFALGEMYQRYQEAQALKAFEAAENGDGPLLASNSAAGGYGTMNQTNQNASMISVGRESILDRPFWPTAFKFFVPASMDIFATTLMNCALIIMPVSIHQMTRGALVMWVGLFSVMFLRHHLRLYQWMSLLMVMMGVCVVGLSSILAQQKAASSIPSAIVMLANAPEYSAAKTLLGILMVMGAQIFAAMQFVWEEKVMEEDHVVEPLLVVGLEGVFGMFQILIAMCVMHYFYGSTPQGKGGFFDMYTGFHQTFGIPSVRFSAVLCALSIALYNSFGLNVTKFMSATARSTIDTSRTLGICAVSLWLGWEVLQPVSGTVQALGFAMVAYGTFVFNKVVAPPAVLLPDEEHPIPGEE